jgi:hypothetical protein
MYYKVYDGHWESLHVVELTKRELKPYVRAHAGWLLLKITGAEAHAWVRKGGIHDTRLYIDQDKRIRRSA